MHDPLPAYRYRLFGMVVASEIELPELPTEQLARPADIFIHLGKGPAAKGHELVIEDVATFRVSCGRTIHIAPEAGVPARNVRLFLLGSAMAVLLHQRGLLPLHANSVVFDGRAIAFTGPSGIGKSTLAARLYDCGHEILADDVSVIAAAAVWSGLEVRPGLPRLRLWRDALERSGRQVDDHELSFAGTRDVRDKYDVMLECPAPSPAPLCAVIELTMDEGEAFRRLDGAEAAAVLIENTYRGHLVNDIGDAERHFDLCVQAAREVPVLKARRPEIDLPIGAWLADLLAALQVN